MELFGSSASPLLKERQVKRGDATITPVFNIDALSSKTKAVMIAHTLGL